MVYESCDLLVEMVNMGRITILFVQQSSECSVKGQELTSTGPVINFGSEFQRNRLHFVVWLATANRWFSWCIIVHLGAGCADKIRDRRGFVQSTSCSPPLGAWGRQLAAKEHIR